MSAIFGIYHLNGQPCSPLELKNMGEQLSHRGRDGAGVWKQGRVGLGHRMLWTTPESLDEQLPAENQSSRLVITADARIDNRADLIQELQLTSSPAQTITDSELISRAYEKWGERCPEKLIGDFVFAIWDAREEKLFCARDPLGVKHFYYCYRPDLIFALASEIKALLCLAEVPRRLNQLGVADYLIPTHEDRVSTLYQDIVRLPAAHCLSISRNGLKLRRYWSPDLSRELKLRSDSDYAEAFRDIFDEAVRARLRSAFPVGSMLSGGLDSSSIVCAASQLLKGQGAPPLHSFSAVFPTLAGVDSRIDERVYVDAVVKASGCTAHYVQADSFSPLQDLQEILWHQDGALAAPNIYMDWAIYRASRENGVRVLLSGTDGDTTVSYGYEDFAGFAHSGRWLTLMKEAYALNKNMPRGSHSLKRLMWHKGFGRLIPERARQYWRLLNGRPRMLDKTGSLPRWIQARPIHPDFANRIGLRERFWGLQQASYPEGASDRKLHWCGISSGMFSYLLESLEKAAAAFDVEPRYPFFDRRLIEFCLVLPPGQKLKNGWTRSILRRAMKNSLPPEVELRADKSNISANFKVKLLEHERELLDEVILHDSKVIEEFIDISALHEHYRRYAAQPLKNEESAFAISLAVNLSLWLRTSGIQSRVESYGDAPAYSMV